MRKIKRPARCAALALCIVFAAVLITGCVSVNFAPGAGGGVTGRGTPERFTYNVGEITEIHVEMLCNIEYYSAPSDTVTLEIHPNLHEYISVTESGGVLTVKTTRTISWSNNNAPVLTVSTPALTNVSLAGAGKFTGHDTITADSFSFVVSGAVSGSADFDVERLSVNIAGAGEYRMSGKAGKADFLLSGASSLDALSLQTRDADVNLSGAGTIKLNCSDNLRVTAAGVGAIEYRGSPSVDISRGGLVTLKKLD